MKPVIRKVPLAEVGAFRAGVGFPVHLQGRPTGELPFAKVSDISRAAKTGQKELVTADNYVHSSDLVELGARPFPAGTIVFPKIGEAIKHNYRVILGTECLVDNNVMGFVPDTSIVDVSYVYHFLRSRDFYQYADKTAVPSLRKTTLERLQIPLRPLDEQRRIAEVLDRAETLRRQRQSALDWLSMLVDVMFAELFQGALSAARWPIVRLGDVAAIQGGLQLSGKRAALPIEVPYLRVANVYRGYIDLTEVKTLRATPEEVSRTRLLANDLLIVEGHGNATEIGRCALWDGSVDPCVHQNHLIRVRVDQERLDPVFLCHYLNSPQGRQHLLRSAKTTSGLNTISTSNVKETPVVVPPMSLQKQFVERVTRVERVRATNLASLAQLEALYASLQHRAFRGEL